MVFRFLSLKDGAPFPIQEYIQKGLSQLLIFGILFAYDWCGEAPKPMVCGKCDGSSSERFAHSYEIIQALFLIVSSMPRSDACVAATQWQGREKAKG